MPTYIIWQDLDGHIHAEVPAPKGRREGESEIAWVERVAKKTEAIHLAEGRTRLANHEEAFPSRTFRNCWRESGGKIEVDMPLARVQRMTEIRAQRDVLLQASDGDKARLDDIGSGPAKSAIAAYRQTLRDLPATVDVESITTPEALEAFAPTFPEKP